MKYFLHDSSAFDDEKITELYIEFGYEGLGLFYTILEKLAKQEKPVKTLVLKQQLKVGKKLQKCWSFMETIGLLSSNNGETFNKQLLNFSEKYAIKKQKNRERISQWRENQDNSENVTRYESVSNTPKVKESKVNRSKVKEIKEKKRKEFIPPALSEVETYFQENGFDKTVAERFFKYYDVAGWKDAKGSQVQNWKQKAQAVWFKDDNRTKLNGSIPKANKWAIYDTQEHD